MELQMQLVQAVHVLNHDHLSCNRVAANHWLVEFQHTDAAWQVATSILTSDAPLMHDLEVSLFAAQILKRKIHNDIGTLQPDARSALQNALLMSATKYSSGPQQLLTQICLALSALIFRSPEARSLIHQLFGSLYELQTQGSGNDAVLELLTVLPEEVTEDRTIHANVNSGRRWQFSEELLVKSPSVLKFLTHLSENDALFLNKRSKILRCFLSWLRMGCFLDSDPSAHPLITYTFACLQVPESFSVATEVLAELIIRHEMVHSTVLLRMVAVKETMLMPALATGNETVVKGLSWLIAELGQAAPGLFARGTPDVLSLAEGLLGCVTFQNSRWDIVDTTLPFWAALGECLLNDSSDKTTSSAAYFPVYKALLDALVVRAQVGGHPYTEDDVDGSTGLPDGLAQLRLNLEETVAVTCRIIGPTQYVAQLLSGLESPVPWQVLEAQFFLLYTASDTILDGPAIDLSSLVSVFLAMTSTEALAGANLLYRSAAQVLGAFARWICSHPTVVFPLLSFLASGLSVPLAASACATALRKICEEVSSMTSDPTNLECLLWIGEGVHKSKLSLKEEEEVLCAIGRALSMVTSSAILNDALRRLLKPAYDSVEALLLADDENHLEAHSAASAALLDASVRSMHRLSTVFSQFHIMCSSTSGGEEVFVGILAQFWPLLERVLGSRLLEHSALATATCKCLCEAIQAGGQRFVPLLPKIMNSLRENFIKFQTHVCFIKLANTITEEHGQLKECGSLFVEIARCFCAAETIAALNSSYACDQEPDVAEAYMSFMSTFLRCCHKDVIVASDAYVEAALYRATFCCTVMHRGAAFAAMSYIACFLRMTRSCVDSYVQSDNLLAGALFKICNQCGESIISGVLYALLGPSAMSRVYKATTILQPLAALCEVCDSSSPDFPVGWSSLQCWIVSSIQALPSEYLRHGEAELLSATWLKALRAAASDGDGGIASQGTRAGYLHGDGGRSLKRVLRDFADQHRMIPVCVI